MKPPTSEIRTARHLANASAIIEALVLDEDGLSRTAAFEPDYLSHAGARDYQRLLFGQFGSIIAKLSCTRISKVPDDWLIVGDRRREVEADILLQIERHGLGIGLLILHAQQMSARHILTRIELDGQPVDLATPTERLPGAKGESVLSIPIRRFRGDSERLAALNIAKPEALWNRRRIVTHERDAHPCFYCSCPEINPGEVTVDLDGSRHGLSRHYTLGFTFAPFGNPLTVTHFLAWDRAHRPLNMNRTPVTVSDLVKLTRELNLSTRTFFAETDVRDAPVLDGVSNGWAGNTIYHQHFQFFQPEYRPPVEAAPAVKTKPLVLRDDVVVERLDWACPIYRIRAADALNTGLVGNDLAGIWRLLGGSRRVPYKTFRDGYVPVEGETVPAHTQNLYVPGRDLGRTAYLVLRDRERVDYLPDTPEAASRAANQKALPKLNVGVLEATGTLIVDEPGAFETMKTWMAEERTRQIDAILRSIAPDDAKVGEFEAAVRGLFPE